MLTLHTMFGARSRIFDLLDASSETALQAARAARELAHGMPARAAGETDFAPSLAACGAARRREKELAAEISQELVTTFVTVLDREDVEAMNAALARIPKTIAKFAARYALVAGRLDGVDFGPRIEILVGCAEIVAKMVAELRHGLRLVPLRGLQRQLQALESEADDLLLDPYRDLYLSAADPMRAVLAKDLFETLEDAIDRCRDVGNVIYAVVLKNH